MAKNIHRKYHKPQQKENQDHKILKLDCKFLLKLAIFFPIFLGRNMYLTVFLMLNIILNTVLISILNPNFLNAQELQTAKNHVKILSSNQFYGRGYVKNGQQKASEYLVEELKKLGVKSFNNDYFQRFTMPVNTFPSPIYLQINKKKLRVGHEFIVRSNTKTAKGKGKICYLDSLFWETENKNNPIFLKKYPIFSTVFLQKKVNFIPVFHAKYEKKIKDLPKNLLEILEKSNIKIVLFDKKPIASVSLYPEKESVFEVKKSDFEACFNEKLPDINTQNNENNPKNSLENEINHAKYEVKYEVKNKFLENYPCQNVLGYTEGTSIKDSFLVVSAHYDHLGGMGQVYFPGASDNASGVSMVLLLAEYFQKNPPKHNVVYIFFGAEEAGIIGSNFYVQNPIFPLKNIKLLLNLDLLATGSEGFMLVNGTVFKDFFDKMVALNNKKKAVSQVKARGKAMNSDHYFFSEKGIPAFFLYTMGGKLYYHDIYDTFDTLPFDKFMEIFGLICAYFEEM